MARLADFSHVALPDSRRNPDGDRTLQALVTAFDNKIGITRQSKKGRPHGRPFLVTG